MSSKQTHPSLRGLRVSEQAEAIQLKLTADYADYRRLFKEKIIKIKICENLLSLSFLTLALILIGLPLLAESVELSKIEDQALLEDIARGNRKDIGNSWTYEDSREEALYKLTNQVLIAEIAKNDESGRVRETAVFLIAHNADVANGWKRFIEKNPVDPALQTFFWEIVKNDKDVGVRHKALEFLTDQKLLADIATESVRKRAAHKLSEQRLPEKIVEAETVKQDKDAGGCEADVTQSENQTFFAVFFERENNEDVDSYIRRMASEKLTDAALLADIATNDESETVRKAAEERLKAWHGIPNAQWVSYWFGEIDALKAGWEPLRDMSVPKGDLEVRVWIWGDYGFAGTRSATEGFRFCRKDGEWMGFYARDDAYSHLQWKYEKNEMNEEEKASYEKRRQELKPVYELTPKTMTWTKFWDKVEALGIVTLPDDSVLDKPLFMNGAVNYIVEVNGGGRYRTYHYAYVDRHHDDTESQKMVAIIKTLDAQFRHAMPPREPHSSWGYWEHED